MYHNIIIAVKYTCTVLPGRPSILTISGSSNSITVQLQLSDIGTAPTLTVELNVTLASHLIDTVKWSGNFIQGKLLDPVIVSSLQPSTNYTFKAVAVNQLGPGSSSIEFIFTEGMNSLHHACIKQDKLVCIINSLNEGAQSHVQQRQIAIIAIAVPVAGGSIVLIGMAITLILCCKYNNGFNLQYNSMYLSSQQFSKYCRLLQDKKE